MYINLDAATPAQAYFHTIQTLVPRPIAWVLSENNAGDYNLAPFSYFTAVCSDPPLLMLSIGKRPDGSPKDTLENIRQRERFVVHIAHDELLEPLNASSANLPAGHSELTQLDLPITDFADFALPRLAEARVAYACTLQQVQFIGNQQQALLFGQIHCIYLDDAITQDQDGKRLKVDYQKLSPIGRLGANEYLCGDRVVRLKRPA